MADTNLKTTFNTAPTLYEDVRPGYPEELIQDVIDLSGLNNSQQNPRSRMRHWKSNPTLCRTRIRISLSGYRYRLNRSCEEKIKGFSKCFVYDRGV